MKRILLLSIFLLVFPNPVVATELSKFLGTWSVNVERTMEEAKNGPEYNPETAEKDKEVLKRLANLFQLKLSESSIVIVRGKTIKDVPYTVKSVSQSSFDAEAIYQEKAVDLSFTLRDGKYLNLKSSDSKDFDIFIWEKAIDGNKVDSETKVIIDIITDQIKND